MWEIEKLSMIACLCFLAVCTYWDIRRRTLPVVLLREGTLLSVLYVVCSGREYWYLHLAGAGVGLFFLLVSKITKEAIGYGDGWMICILGTFLGISDLLEVLAAAWLLLSMTAMICLVKKKWSRKTAFPLVPFLMTGYVFVVASRYL